MNKKTKAQLIDIEKIKEEHSAFRKRTIFLWFKHMRNEPMTEEEIQEYGELTGFLDAKQSD